MPQDPWEDDSVAVAPAPQDPWDAPPNPRAGSSAAPLPPSAGLDPWESAPTAAPDRPRHWWEPAGPASEPPPDLTLDWSTPAATPEILAARNAKFSRDFSLPAGPSPDALWHSLTQPIVSVAHALTPEELAQGWSAAKVILSQKQGETWEDIQRRLGAEPLAKPTGTQKALAGGQQAVAGAVNFFASPVGSLTLGTGALPAAAQKAISAIFVTQMLTSLPDDVQTLAEGYYAGDPEKLTRGAAGLGLNTTFIAQALKHGTATPATPGAPAAAPQPFREPPERLTLTEPLPSEFGGLPTSTPSAPAPHLKDQIASLIDPATGGLTRGGDALKPGMARASEGELVDTLRWARESTPYVRRFVAGDIASELRSRGVPVDAIAWQQENLSPASPEPPAREATPPAASPAPAPEPLTTIEQKYLSADLSARRPLSAALVTRAALALPEGYTLQGDHYTYEAPASRETDTARMAREQREAMAALRALQDAEPPTPTEPAPPETRTPQHAPPSDPWEAPAPQALGERPPDILDHIEANYPNGVRVPQMPDYDEAFSQARGAAKDLLRRTSGEPLDQVLQELHNQGMYRRITTEGELLDAITSAGEARIGHTERAKAAAASEPAPPAREPWQMTKEEYAADTREKLAKTNAELKALGFSGETPPNMSAHYYSVKNALEHGEHVPAEVLSEYPDLAPSAEPGGLESWADRTIAAGKTRLHAGLDPELLTAYAVKGAFHVARGLRDFAGWSAAMLQEFGEAVRPHLATIYRLATDQPGLRQAVAKIQVDPTVSDPVKAATLADFDYQVRTHESLDKQADTLLQHYGPDDAFTLYRERAFRGMPDDLAERLKQKLLAASKTAEATARATQDTAAETAAQERQYQIYKADAYGTAFAQAMSARQTTSDMSAGSHLRQARDIFLAAGQRTLDALQPHIDAIGHAVGSAHTEALGQLRADPAANTAARAAVDHAVANSHETHAAVVMELAGPWSESPAILAQAREAVRAKANELLNRSPRPPGLTAPAHLRAILDDLAQRAATIAAGHYQGADPGLTLTAKLEQRLGLTTDAATRLAKRLDAEFAAQVKKAGEALPKRIARARVAQGQNLPPTASDPVVDRAIRKQLATRNTQLGTLLQQHATAADTTGKSIGDRIVADSGLTVAPADQLRATLDRRWAALSDTARQRALDKLAASPIAPAAGALLRNYQRLMKLARLGAFNDPRLRDNLAKSLGLPELTDDISREIVRRSSAIDRLPEGELRERAGAELLNWIHRQAGTKWSDVPMAMFFANALSGLTTAAVVPLENIASLAGSTAVALVRGQVNPLAVTRAAGRGAVRGVLHATEIMRSGIVTGVKGTVRASNTLELKPFGDKGDWFNYWKWFGREIAALHVVTFRPAAEVRQAVLAARLAKSEGLRGPAAWSRAREILGLVPERIAAAQAQAAGELSSLGNTSRLDYRRRVGEILDQQRETTMPGSTEDASDFALRVTYLGRPYGVLGDFAEGLRLNLQQIGEAHGWVGKIPRTQMPFIRIAANMLNEKLNWTPAGAFRAASAQRTGELYGRPVKQGEIGDLYAKAILGTAISGAVAAWYADHIHGSGPSDPEHRKQLQAAGWIPHSIELNGRHYTYARTPLAVPLAIIGNWTDWHRYGKGEQADGEQRIAYLAKAAADTFVSQSFLDQARRMLDALGDPNTGTGAAKLESALARTASTFVVPNLALQVDKIFDPTVYDQTGILAALASQVPILRHEAGLRPALNALGEPVQSAPFDRWSHALTSDPVWRAIAAQQSWIPTPPREIIIGDKSRGPDHWRPMTPDERYEYLSDTGQLLRDRLNPDRLMDLEPDQARAYVRKLSTEIHTKAKARYGL